MSWRGSKKNLQIENGRKTGRKTVVSDIKKYLLEMYYEANGKLTKVEALGHREFGIYKLISTF